MAAQYDLNLNKNSSFSAWVQFLQDDNTPVDLSGYSAEFKIERYKNADYPLVRAIPGEARYGYTGPSSTGILATSGGIQLNTNYTGSGLTGGILVELNKTTTNSLPVGKQFYNLRLEFGESYSEVLLEGRMDVKPE
jgi:hypothetical protein